MLTPTYLLAHIETKRVGNIRRTERRTERRSSSTILRPHLPLYLLYPLPPQLPHTTGLQTALSRAR